LRRRRGRARLATPGLMSETVLLHLGGDPVDARRRLEAAVSGAEVDVVGLSELRGRRDALSGCRTLGLVGNPPEDEIGYGFAPLVAALSRPERVALVGLNGTPPRIEPRAEFLRGSLAGAVAQLCTSAVAIGAQRVLARLLDSSAPVRPRAGARLRRLVYVRPLVGIPAAFGGSITHTQEVIHALGQIGVAVEAHTTDPLIAGATEGTDWKTTRVPRALRGVPASAGLGGDMALLARALPAARRADAVYQRHTRFSLSGALLARLARRPFILEYNGSEAFFGSHWMPTPFAAQLLACENAALAAAALIVVVAHVERDLLVERGIDPERILVNPNGVDADRFVPGTGAALRRTLGFGEDDVVIGFLGSFGPWHGAPVLAQSFAALAQDEPRARLLLVGEGPEKERVREILAEGGVLDRAVFAGRVAPSAVPAHLDACDVLASPHVPLPGGVEFFGSPTKLFEYMAAGRAIAATSLGQIGDVLDHGQTALMSEPGSADQLTESLRALAADPELRDRLGREARRVAEERHSWRLNAQRVADAFAGTAVAA
jgi:glycosyltransferase involved in cell wall biosynthesis